MTSIETTQVDAYVQNLCLGRPDLPASARSASATRAITTHVAQEHDLLMNTSLFIETDIIDYEADRLVAKGKVMMENLRALAGRKSTEFAGYLFIPSRVSFETENWPAMITAGDES